MPPDMATKQTKNVQISKRKMEEENVATDSGTHTLGSTPVADFTATQDRGQHMEHMARNMLLVPAGILSTDHLWLHRGWQIHQGLESETSEQLPACAAFSQTCLCLAVGGCPQQLPS